MIRRGNNSAEDRLSDFKKRLGDAREKLAVLKDNRGRLAQELKAFNATTAEQARAKSEELEKEASALNSEAALLLDRAGKLLERFEG
jgi:predicted nuclease with TOPRIM domain